MSDDRSMRMPTKPVALRQLKQRGLRVDNIVDVGIYKDTRELREAFPASFHLLFEPLEHLAPQIEANYKDIDHELVVAACSSEPGEGFLKLIRHQGGEGQVTHSTLSLTPPASDAEGEFKPIPVVRVDDAVKAANLSGNILLKIDVDGHDMNVLRGAEGILDRVDVVVIECLFLSWIDRAVFLHDKGFRLFDVVDLVYYDDIFWQMDLVFISPRLAANADFLPHRGQSPNLSLFKGYY